MHLVLQQLPIDAGFQMTTVVFFTPAERAMAVAEARGRGYGIANTDSRLVLRGPKASPETYTQNVSGARLPPAIFPPPDGASREYLQPIWINDVCFSFAASALMELCQTAVALFSKWIIPSDSLLVNFQFQGPSSRLDTVMQGSKGPILCKILYFANVFFVCFF